jgi:hypothetical protein
MAALRVLCLTDPPKSAPSPPVTGDRRPPSLNNGGTGDLSSLLQYWPINWMNYLASNAEAALDAYRNSPYNKSMKKRLLFIRVALVLCGLLLVLCGVAIAPLLGGTGQPIIVKKVPNWGFVGATTPDHTAIFLRPPGGKEIIVECIPGCWWKTRTTRTDYVVPRGVVHVQGWPYDQDCLEWHYQGKDGAFSSRYVAPGTHVRVPWTDGTTAEFIVDGPAMRPEWQAARDRYDRVWMIKHSRPASSFVAPPVAAEQWPSVSVRPPVRMPGPNPPVNPFWVTTYKLLR